MLPLVGKRRRRFPLAVLWLGVVASWLLPAIATAEIIATDNFNSYSVGNLGAQGSASSGWMGPWAAGAVTGLNIETVDTSSSGAISVTPAGGSAINGGTRAVDVYPPTGAGTAGKTGIAVTRQLSGTQTGTFYAGFVMKWMSGAFNSGDTFALHFTNSATDADNGFNFGYRGLPTAYGVMVRKGTGNPVTGAFSTFASSTNTTVRYLVAKVEKVASVNYNKITVWIDPGTTAEVDRPNGDCQLSGLDSGLDSISSVNIRVENLRSPDAGSNGNDKVRMDSLTLATSFADMMADASTVRPFIWVRSSEKADILAKIATNPWATSVLNSMVTRVASDVSSHQSNRDTFLRELPVDWTLSPAKFKTTPAYAESIVSGPAESKFNDGVDCAVLYYLTGDTNYARCAADILHNAVKTLLPVAPSTGVTNGGWIWQNEFLYEARKTGTQLGIIYDFLHGYLQTNQVYDVQTAGMVDFSFPNAQNVFRTFYQLARDHGSADSNWSALMSTSMLNSILALDDSAERAAALQVYLTTGASRQASLSQDYAYFSQPGNIYNESLQYAAGVGNIRATHMVLLERYDPGLNLFGAYPNLPTSLPRISYLQYPNEQQISFGDGHRDTDGQPFFEYEIVYQHARTRGLTNLTQLLGPLINGGISAGKYNRSSLESYGALGMHNEPLQLLWFAPEVAEPGAALELPRTDTLPYAGIALQRNLSSAGNTYGMMAFVGGAGHVHSHASGMSMELYGMGQVLGAKSGRTDYNATENENYYRVFASNNTVIVNGASRGEGPWGGFDMNTVQVESMEPQAFATAVSPDVSFTCSSFLDDRGTLAEGTQQRTLALIRTSPTTGYYVDLFRSQSSRSGQFHDYLYHNVGDILSIEANAAPLPLTSQPALFQTDIGDVNEQPGWRYFTNTEVSATTTATVRARFGASLSAGQTYMEVHLPGATGREYAKVKAPAIVEAPAPYDSALSSALVVRQTGEAWNRPFAAVYEPHRGTATSGTVQNVTKIEKSGVVVGLKVESIVAGKNVTQYVISNPGPTDTYTDASVGLSFTGRFAVVTDSGDYSGSLYLGDGSSLSYKGRNVVSQSGLNTQANVAHALGQAPVITSNAPVNVSNPAHPTITGIADLLILVNTATDPIPFTIGDDSTAASALTVSATSSNTTLVPVSGIVFGGSGANRNAVITPAANQSGTATIQIRVSDGTYVAASEFVLTVFSPYEVSGTMLSGATDASVTEAPAVADVTSTTVLVGTGGSSPFVDRCAVFVFQLPPLGAVANPFSATSFTFNYAAKTSTLVNNDLHGLGRRTAATVLPSDYYGQTATPDPTDATILQASILDNSTPLGLISTSGGGSTALRDYLNAQYAAGAGAGKYVFLRVNTAGAKTGVKRATLTMSEGGDAGPPDTRPQISYTAMAENQPPTITDIANRSIAPNASTGAIPFTIGDPETPTYLTLSKSSSNPTLVPSANIVLGGSGANRTVTVTPVANQLGSATITVTVSDSLKTTSDTFLVTVAGTASETWRFTHFGTTANAGTAADTVDANSDGESNLLEFGTGQNPNAATLTATPLARNGANLEFTYTRSKAAMADGILFAVEWCDALAAGTWSGSGVTEQLLTDNGTVQTIKATLPAGTGGRRFVHLRLAKP